MIKGKRQSTQRITVRVLLVQPAFKKTEISYPLGLAYLSSTLKQHGHETIGIDLSFNSNAEAVSLVREKRIDHVGISLTSFNLSSGLEFLRYLRNNAAVPVPVASISE